MTHPIPHPVFIAADLLILPVLSGTGMAAALAGFLLSRRKRHLSYLPENIPCPGCDFVLEYIEEYGGWYCIRCEDYFDKKDIGRKL